jgi:ABC-type nitrate/sulfonate/bicarbonate transport system substrate-binding protein
MKLRAALASVVVLLPLAACGGDDGESSAGFASGEGSLAGVCPDNVVFQTDWNPEAEHGFLYNLVGEGYVVDTAKAAVKGPLWSEGVDTGVAVEIRSGGPAVSFSPVISEMYTKPEIMLGFVSTDTQIAQSVEFPTKAVVAPFNINPQIVMWDPATYPEVKQIADLKAKGVKIRSFQGVSYIKFLVRSGIIDESQVDATYDGTPASFIAAAGKDAQQGFGTSEPFFYEEVLAEWSKPVAYQYLHDAGWTTYAQSLAGTPEVIEANAECLAKLVPVIQRSQVEYVGSPDRANAVIVDAVEQINNGWVYTADQAAASVAKQIEDRLVANSPDGTLGSFDLDRIEDFITKATPIFSAEGGKVKEGLSAADLVTNEFIDPSVKLDD